jgi:hypothetical protein
MSIFTDIPISDSNSKVPQRAAPPFVLNNSNESVDLDPVATHPADPGLRRLAAIISSGTENLL